MSARGARKPAKARSSPSPSARPKANAAIHFAMDAYDTSRPKLMGRHAAGEGFLASYARHAEADQLFCFARSRKDFVAFDEMAAREGNTRPCVWMPYHEPHKLAEAGCLFTPDPNITRYAWLRRHRDERAYSLVGVFHTTASHSVMGEIASFLTAPVQPWDASICPSRAVKQKVERLLEWQAEYLAARVGGKARRVHQLPVIPLGVDCDRFDPTTTQAAKARERVRRRFEVGEDDIMVLFVGRLAFHAKANPIPMYMALEAAAQRTDKRIVLVLSGWFGGDSVRDQFSRAARTLAPSVKIVSVDGRRPDTRFDIWQGADIFTSLPDNVQETFGLTPIEAMAAGLPVVGSAWDGYRDTVRDGTDGILVPTLMAAPGDGEDLALRHDAGTDDYDHYVGSAAQFVAVDPGRAADAFVALIENPELRRTMGTAGRKRARAGFDWKVVVGQYQELWAELEARRATDAPVAPKADGAPANPARGDPFALFAHYPTRTLDPDVILARGLKSLDEAMELGFMARINAMLGAPEVDLATVLAHVETHGASTCGELVALVPPERQVVLRRSLVWLVKVGVLAVDWTEG